MLDHVADRREYGTAVFGVEYKMMMYSDLVDSTRWIMRCSLSYCSREKLAFQVYCPTFDRLLFRIEIDGRSLLPPRTRACFDTTALTFFVFVTLKRKYL